MQVVVKASLPGGYNGHGRHWPAKEVPLEVVDEPEAEKAKDGDDFATRDRKHELRCARIQSGKVTHVELDRIKADRYLAEVVVPPCENCSRLQAEIDRLRGNKAKAA